MHIHFILEKSDVMFDIKAKLYKKLFTNSLCTEVGKSGLRVLSALSLSVWSAQLAFPKSCMFTGHDDLGYLHSLSSKLAESL